MNSANRNSSLNELHTVQAILVDAIRYAQTWHEIHKAADALFHARLVWKMLYGEEPSSEGAAVGGAPQPLGIVGQGVSEAFRKGA